MIDHKKRCPVRSRKHQLNRNDLFITQRFRSDRTSVDSPKQNDKQFTSQNHSLIINNKTKNAAADCRKCCSCCLHGVPFDGYIWINWNGYVGMAPRQRELSSHLGNWVLRNGGATPPPHGYEVESHCRYHCTTSMTHHLMTHHLYHSHYYFQCRNTCIEFQ